MEASSSTSIMLLEQQDESSSDLVSIEGRRIIRRFSDQLEGNETLEQTLKEDVARRERRSMFEGAPAGEGDEDQLDEIAVVWAKYIEQNAEQPNKRRWLGLKKPKKTESLQELKVASFEDVMDVVNGAQDKWKAGHGKASQNFHKVCNTLDNHKALFSIFPSDDKYVSFFCGSLQILVGASVYHQKVAERLSRGILEVCEEVASCLLLKRVMDTASMKRRIASIYLLVFDFFQQAMKWFRGNKVLSSLDAGLFDEFEISIKKIKDAVYSMHREGMTGGLAENRETRQTAEETMVIAAETNARIRTFDQRFDRLEEKLARMEVGSMMNFSLHDIFRMAQRSLLVLDVQSQLPAGIQDPLAIMPGNSERVSQLQLKEEVLRYSKSLDSFIVGTNALPPVPNVLPVYAEGLVIYRLQKWISAENSEFLWIVGAPELCMPSAMAAAASNVVVSATASEVPVVEHICKRPLHSSLSSQTVEEAAMIGLAYNLIQQLLQFLSSEVDNSLDLSEERFSALDGTTQSWTKALSLLKDLIDAAPPLLLCVIDGLDKLDLHNASAMCEAFLNTLRQSSHQGGDNKVFKVLLTTSGMSTTLNAQIQAQERYFALDSHEGDGDRAEILMHVSFT